MQNVSQWALFHLCRTRRLKHVFLPFPTSSSPSTSTSVLNRVPVIAFPVAISPSLCLTPPFSAGPGPSPIVLTLPALELELLPPKLFLLNRLFRRLGARVPMGLYVLWKLRRRHESAKLKLSSFSLCSFVGGLRYLGRGMGSPGW